MEFTVYSCDNSKPFEARVFNPEDVANEPRGKGQVGDRCLRYVRTIFDESIASVRNLLRSVATGVSVYSDFDNGCRVQELTDAMDSSSSQGGWVTTDPALQ